MIPYTHEELTLYCSELINYLQGEGKRLPDKTKSEIWQEIKDIENGINWRNQLNQQP